MSHLASARSAYAQHHAPSRTPRAIEYDLLARTTQRLAVAWTTRADQFPALARAVSDNVTLWTTFAADLAGADNALPAPLRARLFYLYEFTAAHSRRILDGSGSAEVLIDINTAVMRGLRGEGPAP